MYGRILNSACTYIAACGYNCFSIDAVYYIACIVYVLDITWVSK